MVLKNGVEKYSDVFCQEECSTKRVFKTCAPMQFQVVISRLVLVQENLPSYFNKGRIYLVRIMNYVIFGMNIKVYIERSNRILAVGNNGKVANNPSK